MSTGPRWVAGRRGSRTRGGRCLPAPDLGQGTVELVVLLPVVVILALAVAQIGVLVQHRVMLTHAAREVARAASVAGGEVDPATATGLDGGLDPSRLDVETRLAGGSVVVELRYRDPTDVPLVGALVPDVLLEAKASMLVEG